MTIVVLDIKNRRAIKGLYMEVTDSSEDFVYCEGVSANEITVACLENQITVRNLHSI